MTSTSSAPPAAGSRDTSRPAAPIALDRSFAGARIARVATLAVSDFAALILAGLLAYTIWALPAKEQSLSLYVELVPLVALFLIGYAQSGLYPGLGLGPVETLRRQSYVTAFGYLVLAAFSFAL